MTTATQTQSRPRRERPKPLRLSEAAAARLRDIMEKSDGRYTGVFELICPSCGDHPYLDYTEVPLRLQWLRGPRALGAALAAYHKHIGASPRPDGDRAGSLGPASGKERRGARAAAGTVGGPRRM